MTVLIILGPMKSLVLSKSSLKYRRVKGRTLGSEGSAGTSAAAAGAGRAGERPKR